MQTEHLKQFAATKAGEHIAEAGRLMGMIEKATITTGPQFSLARMITGMSQESLAGLEREQCQEWAHAAGTKFDPQRVQIPFSALRDLSKGTASAGGYLVGADTPDALDALRPWSVTARAGVQMEPGHVGDVLLPKITGTSTAYWLSSETSTVTASAQTIGQVAAAPKTVGVLVNFSRQLSLQANIDRFLRRELARTAATAIDQAVLNGSSAAGQPLGLLNTTGIGTQSGTSLAHSGVVAMKATVATANANDEAIAFIGTPAVRELLEARERAAGSGYVWDNDRVASRPAYATTDMPSATLVCGDWSQITVPIWGGIVVEINPYANFQAGTIAARLLVSLDVMVQHPDAFSVATSIT